MNFISSNNFLLENKTAETLYHEYAADTPIYDYHNHLPVREILEDRNYDNLTQTWLYGDHYKWRVMRTNGINEKYITGQSSDFEKFFKWAETMPYCIGNPLYHWTHLELKNPFGIKDRLLNPDTAESIYKETAEMLATPEFSTRNLLRNFNVKLICTTEDPLDSLEHHEKIRKDNFEIAVHTAWRPDKALAVENPAAFNVWVDRLGELTDSEISSFDDFLAAIKKRHDVFHAHGCRLSDTALTRVAFSQYTESQLKEIFTRLRSGSRLSAEQVTRFRSGMLVELSAMNADRDWVQQFHIGALRNNNSGMFEKLGPDSGFDSIADYPVAAPLAALLDHLASRDKLAKTILYNLNPADNAAIAAMIGNFQDGTCPGRMQFGSAWWFMDHKNGIEQHLQTLANLSLLTRFIGMLTDSRSFLSFSRHEYFRRILCNLLGRKVQTGLIPDDMELLGRTVRDICFNNAKNYFRMQLGPALSSKLL